MLMRFLIFLRDTVLPYIFMIILVGGGLGSIAWLVATTYFWQTSQLTVLVDESVTAAEIHISSRLIYQDFQIFGVTYPFHIIFPWTQKVICANKECIFSGLPRGDAEIAFVDTNGATGGERVLIAPDTLGTIDLRSVILARVVNDLAGTGFIVQKTDTLPGDIPAGAIFSENALQGLFLFWNEGILFLYDTSGKQNILLPQNLSIQSIVRGLQEGSYYLITDQNEVWSYDRYGRIKTEKASHSASGDRDLIWEGTQTRLKIGTKEQVLPGTVFWFVHDTKNYLFDGNKIYEIINI